MTYVAMYLGAIVAANLLTARFGPAVTVVNALVFVGLDLTTRDRLHELWAGRWLWPRMLALIVVGSGLSWLLNRAAGQIALASLVAFLAAGVVDALIYHLTWKWPWLARVNGSNVAGSLVDSILFPTLAFGEVLPLVIMGQFAAKVAGVASRGYEPGEAQRHRGDRTNRRAAPDRAAAR